MKQKRFSCFFLFLNFLPTFLLFPAVFLLIGVFLLLGSQHNRHGPRCPGCPRPILQHIRTKTKVYPVFQISLLPHLKRQHLINTIHCHAQQPLQLRHTALNFKSGCNRCFHETRHYQPLKTLSLKKIFMG